MFTFPAIIYHARPRHANNVMSTGTSKYEALRMKSRNTHHIVRFMAGPNPSRLSFPTLFMVMENKLREKARFREKSYQQERMWQAT